MTEAEWKLLELASAVRNVTVVLRNSRPENTFQQLTQARQLLERALEAATPACVAVERRKRRGSIADRELIERPTVAVVRSHDGFEEGTS